MQIAEEFAEDIRRFAIVNYGDLLIQFHRLRDRYSNDGTHPDVVKAKEYLDHARRLRCEVDPEFAAEQMTQVAA